MQLAVDVQIPEILGGMDGETVYIGTYISQLSAYIDFSQFLQCIIFRPGGEGWRMGGVEEAFHVLVAYPNSIT